MRDSTMQGGQVALNGHTPKVSLQGAQRDVLPERVGLVCGDDIEGPDRGGEHLRDRLPDHARVPRELLNGVDELAGRRVGLAAVRVELAEVGYEVVVSKSSARGTTMRIRPRRP